MALNISKTLRLPEDAALWSIAELAIRGAGKTYTASVIAEEAKARWERAKAAIDSLFMVLTKEGTG